MHPGLRLCARDNGRRAPDVIRVGVGEDEVAEILRPSAEALQRVENRILVIRKAGIDQNELAAVPLEQHAVDEAEGHEPRSLNDLLHVVTLRSKLQNQL